MCYKAVHTQANRLRNLVVFDSKYVIEKSTHFDIILAAHQVCQVDKLCLLCVLFVERLDTV